MICETITVTDTPTSVKNLVATARDVESPHAIPQRGELILYYPVATSTVVFASDPDSDAPAEILHGDTQGIGRVQLQDVCIDDLLLSVTSGTQEVDIIFTKGAVA